MSNKRRAPDSGRYMPTSKAVKRVSHSSLSSLLPQPHTSRVTRLPAAASKAVPSKPTRLLTRSPSSDEDSVGPRLRRQPGRPGKKVVTISDDEEEDEEDDYDEEEDVDEEDEEEGVSQTSDPEDDEVEEEQEDEEEEEVADDEEDDGEEEEDVMDGEEDEEEGSELTGDSGYHSGDGPSPMASSRVRTTALIFLLALVAISIVVLEFPPEQQRQDQTFQQQQCHFISAPHALLD
jgi:hypothetical protein